MIGMNGLNDFNMAARKNHQKKVVILIAEQIFGN
jgi:hypothetical protein